MHLTRVNKSRTKEPADEIIVIVGAGQSGAQAAITLREHNFPGRILLLGNEPQAPYQRPPLSKKFLAGALSVERLLLRPISYYTENDIDLRLHSHVEAVDRKRGRIYVQGAGNIPYDKLLLATGSHPRLLRVPGSRGADIHYLRSLQDALSLRAKISGSTRVAIVGGGYVGLEVAAVARSAGASVLVFEGQDRILTRVTTTDVSRFFSTVHQRYGVDIHCSARVDALEGGERLEAIVVDGTRMRADVAVIGIGAEPNIELAADAGLLCDNGILVDEYCRTSDPRIYAAGDCTCHPNSLLNARLRLESVQNAVDQATTAALNMTGLEQSYSEVPWFWSNQYQHKIQSAGFFDGHDEIEQRGDPDNERFALLYRRQGELIGVDAVNLPREYMEARKMLDQQRLVSRSRRPERDDRLRAHAA